MWGVRKGEKIDHFQYPPQLSTRATRMQKAFLRRSSMRECFGQVMVERMKATLRYGAWCSITAPGSDIGVYLSDGMGPKAPNQHFPSNLILDSADPCHVLGVMGKLLDFV